MTLQGQLLLTIFLFLKNLTAQVNCKLCTEDLLVEEPALNLQFGLQNFEVQPAHCPTGAAANFAKRVQLF